MHLRTQSHPPVLARSATRMHASPWVAATFCVALLSATNSAPAQPPSGFEPSRQELRPALDARAARLGDALPRVHRRGDGLPRFDRPGDDPCTPARFTGEYVRVGDSPALQIAVYELSTGADLGFGGPGPDRIELQFFDSAYNATGAFDLTAGGNANFATCAVCVLVVQEVGGGAGVEKQLFQSAGVLTVHPSTPPGPSPVLDIELFGVRVVEVTIDPDTFVSTPVPGGACYREGDVLFRNGFES